VCDKRTNVTKYINIKYMHALQHKVKIKYKNTDITYNVNVIIK